MGIDHLVCEKCKVGFNLESGHVFWVGHFIHDHWHSKKNVPNDSYFAVKFWEFPKHLQIHHNVAVGTLSVTEATTWCEELTDAGRCVGVSGMCFHKKHFIREMEARKRYWTSWERFKFYLGTVWSALKGGWVREIEEDDPHFVEER